MIKKEIQDCSANDLIIGAIYKIVKSKNKNLADSEAETIANNIFENNNSLVEELNNLVNEALLF